MATPSKLVQTYGPIVEFVTPAAAYKGSEVRGFICKKGRGLTDYITAIITRGEDMFVKHYPAWDLDSARQWIREN